MTRLPVGYPGVYDIGVLDAFVHALPVDEQHAAMVLTFNLVRLSTYANDFCAAVALLDFSELESQKVMSLTPDIKAQPELARVVHTLALWGEMAARDAVMSVFHFGKTIEAIRGGFQELPSVRGGVDHPKLREASKRFHIEFPGFAKARHGVGHLAETTSSLSAIKAHSSKGELIFGALKDRQYTVTHDGEHHTLLVASATHMILVDIAAQVFQGFPKLMGQLPSLRNAGCPEGSNSNPGGSF